MEKKGWVAGLRIINVNLTKGSAAIKKLFVIISRVKYRVPAEYLNVEIKDLKKSYIPTSALEPCVKVPETKLLGPEELQMGYFGVAINPILPTGMTLRIEIISNFTKNEWTEVDNI